MTASCAWSVDAAGGDNAPEEIVKGALDAVGPQLQVILVGDEPRVRALLPPGVQNVSVVHAPEVIGYDEEPATAARAKTGSSIVIGLKMVHDGEADAFVSAGNTGAVVAASVLYVRRIPGVKRPAICTIMPAMPAPVAFLDVGANAECRAEYLRQFAVMGQAFAREVMGIPEPTIGLLSIGEEPTKGTPEVIEAHQLIAAEERIAHFYGNIEGRDIMNRLVDVIVTDGFTGNVALKTIEGSAKAIMGALKAVDPGQRQDQDGWPAAPEGPADPPRRAQPRGVRRRAARRHERAGRHRPRQLEGARHRAGGPHGPARPGQRPAPHDRPGAWDADHLGVDSPKLARRFTA